MYVDDDVVLRVHRKLKTYSSNCLKNKYVVIFTIGLNLFSIFLIVFLFFGVYVCVNELGHNNRLMVVGPTIVSCTRQTRKMVAGCKYFTGPCVATWLKGR